MLATSKVYEIEQMLADGNLSQRSIARLTGVSRASVRSIASGDRPDYEARRRALAEELAPPGPLERCSGCGGLVHMPCRLCRIRQIKQRELEARRQRRRQLRELAVKKLLAAVWRASQQREAHVARQAKAG